MHNFNAVVAFVMVIVFGAFFAVEVQENAKSLRSQNDALVSVSSVDPLTGLLKRRSMDKHLAKVVSEAKVKGEMFAVIIADIDNFKKVNDTYGHNMGDEVLVDVSEAFKQNVTPSCSICRWGGEEILVLVPEGLEVARKVADEHLYFGKKHGKNCVVC